MVLINRSIKCCCCMSESHLATTTHLSCRWKHQSWHIPAGNTTSWCNIVVNVYTQCGKLNFWSTRPKTDVLYMFYTKFHLPRPIFYSTSVSFHHWYLTLWGAYFTYNYCFIAITFGGYDFVFLIQIVTPWSLQNLAHDISIMHLQTS